MKFVHGRKWVFGVMCSMVLCLGSANSQTQTDVYSVSIAGKTVGSLRVFKNLSPSADRDSKVQKVESDFKFLFRSGKFSSQSFFENGHLVNSVSSHHVNGDLKEQTRTLIKPGHIYEVFFSEEKNSVVKTKKLSYPINNTLTSLFYGEPVDVKEVYSERFGQMCSVRKMTSKEYQVTLPDGKRNSYFYTSGQCTEVETELAGLKLRITLNDKN